MVIYTKRKSYGVRVEIWLYVGVNPLGRVDIKKGANFHWDGILLCIWIANSVWMPKTLGNCYFCTLER